MDVELNGKPHSVRADSTVLDLIAGLGLRPRGVVVERNGQPVVRDRFGATRLEPGDVIEVVRAVAGG